MTEPQVTMTGPAQLRFMAEASRANGYTRLGSDLDQLAVLWEADLERAARDHDLATSIMAERLERAEKAEARATELERRMRSKTMALQEAEESVDRLQSSKAALQAEIRGLYAASPTLSEWAELTQARSKAEAALERARAALQEIANSLEADGGAPLSLAVAKAALLSAAPGGAELDAALSDLTMRPRTGAGGGPHVD